MPSSETEDWPETAHRCVACRKKGMGRIAVAELRAKHNAYDRYDLPTRLVGLARSVHGAGRGTRCAEDGGDESCGPQWSAQTEKTDSMKKQLGFFQQVEGGPSMSPSSHADLARPSEWEISQTPATGLPEETGQSWSCRFDPCMPSLESKTIQRRSRSGHVVCVAIGRLCCWVLTLWVSTVLLWEPVSAANSSPYNRALSISENPAARELVLATWNQQKLREFVELGRLLHVKTYSAEQLGLKAPVSGRGGGSKSMEDDAEAKAVAVARAAQRAALADCAVLCVPALNNAPGLDAERMVVEGGGWEGAMELLHQRLLLLQPHPNDADPSASRAAIDMRATYHCTMTLAFPSGKKLTVSDALSGKLVWPPRGEATQGSGFYSIFIPEGEAQTLQEMNLGAFEAMANSNHRFGAFEEMVKGMMGADMAEVAVLYNPLAAYRDKYKHMAHEPCTPLQDLFEYVRPPGTDIVNNEYIKPYVNDNSRHILYPELPSEEDLVWLLENDADLVADDCQAMMRKADELSCAAAEAEAAGRDALTLEAQAMDMAERAVYLADRLQLPHLQATALLNLATLVGPTPKALDMLHKALALADDNEDLILVCIALGKIAAVHCKLGDVDAGLECLETTRKVAVAHEMLWLLGLVYCSYTELLIEHGEDEKAMTYGHETLRLAKQENDLELVLKASALVVSLHASKGEHAEAHEARGIGLEAAAAAAARLQDVDAVLAAEAALEEWRKQGDEMHVSPRMLSPALQAQDAATLPGPHLGDMQDTPLRVESSHGMAGGSRGSGGAGVERGAARASRLPPPMAHRGTGSRRGGVI